MLFDNKAADLNWERLAIIIVVASTVSLKSNLHKQQASWEKKLKTIKPHKTRSSLFSEIFFNFNLTKHFFFRYLPTVIIGWCWYNMKLKFKHELAPSIHHEELIYTKSILCDFRTRWRSLPLVKRNKRFKKQNRDFYSWSVSFSDFEFL